MAWDTSRLTPDVHARVASGESIAAIAESFDPPVRVEAIKQYMRKVDANGRQVAQNGRTPKVAK